VNTRNAGRGARGRDEHGAIAVVSALVAVVLLLISAFVVDIGSTWARRGQLQVQADKAALLAAESLPAVDAASRQDVAKFVAYYVSCHTVSGQRTLNADIPSCPAGTTPDSPEVLAYAQGLLDNGQAGRWRRGTVTFPTSTQVKVTTPEARVEFAFGGVADVEYSDQSKMAIARISSPGDLLPMGLSLECLLSAAGSLPLAGDDASGVVPLNYVTPGPLVPAGSAGPTQWPNGYATSSAADRPAVTGITTLPSPVVSGPTPATFTLTGSGWGLLSDVQVVFHRGSASGTPVPADSVQATVLDPVTGTTTATGVLPGTVMQTPGTWQVKVGVRRVAAGSRLWSEALTLGVNAPATLTESLGCTRMLNSPRADVLPEGAALERNLQEGIDHGLLAHPNLVTVNQPGLSAEDLLQTAANATTAFGCSNSSPNVLDLRDPVGTPNCVLLQNNQGFVGNSFTTGVLAAERDGVAGRLVCSDARPCRHATAQVRGVQINADSFDDYVQDANLLNDQLFFNLSTYLTQGVPLLTPEESALSQDIYGSHRFMWAPVIGAPLAPNSAGHYPVLTFRPIFVTQDAPSGWDSYDLLFDSASSVPASLGLYEDDVEHGLLLSQDGETLKAMRFMTIEPSALPLVGSGYDGPTAEYLGVGPKIVKLVR
jgi:hypothetical protein